MRFNIPVGTGAAAFPRAFLWVNVALFGIYGLAYLIAPDALTALLAGASYPNANVAIDARAVYGGLSLGLAAFCVLSVRGGVELQRAGLLACAAAYGSLALGRLIGILVTGSFSPFMCVLCAAEALFALLCGYASKALAAR